MGVIKATADNIYNNISLPLTKVGVDEGLQGDMTEAARRKIALLSTRLGVYASALDELDHYNTDMANTQQDLPTAQGTTVLREDQLNLIMGKGDGKFLGFLGTVINHVNIVDGNIESMTSTDADNWGAFEGNDRSSSTLDRSNVSTDPALKHDMQNKYDACEKEYTSRFDAVSSSVAGITSQDEVSKSGGDLHVNPTRLAAFDKALGGKFQDGDLEFGDSSLGKALNNLKIDGKSLEDYNDSFSPGAKDTKSAVGGGSESGESSGSASGGAAGRAGSVGGGSFGRSAGSTSPSGRGSKSTFKKVSADDILGDLMDKYVEGSGSGTTGTSSHGGSSKNGTDSRYHGSSYTPGEYSGYSGSGYTPSSYSSRKYTPASYTPSSYTPSSYTSSKYTPSSYSPTGSTAYTPKSYTGSNGSGTSGYTPSSYTPSSYTSSGYTPGAHSSSGYTPSSYTSSGYTPSKYTPSTYTSSAGTSTPSSYTPSQYSSSGYTPRSYSGSGYGNGSNGYNSLYGGSTPYSSAYGGSGSPSGGSRFGGTGLGSYGSAGSGLGGTGAGPNNTLKNASTAGTAGSGAAKNGLAGLAGKSGTSGTGAPMRGMGMMPMGMGAMGGAGGRGAKGGKVGAQDSKSKIKNQDGDLYGADVKAVTPVISVQPAFAPEKEVTPETEGSKTDMSFEEFKLRADDNK